MIKTNADRLVMVSVQGQISPQTRHSVYTVGHDGVARILPEVGGITYNVRVGDPAFGWAGDHVEPGVSIKVKDIDENAGLNFLSCIGNEAVVVSGEAKGERGVVTGKHGGIEHVLVSFPRNVLDRLAIEDKILVRAFGQGLEFPDLPEVRAANADPRLLESMEVEITAGGKLRVPVAAFVPSHIMGSGLGAPSAERGDYDITTQDPAVLRELGLEGLRLGDVVAIQDMSSYYGRSFRRGAVIVGVIVHTDSHISGHGPGVTTILTSNSGVIEPVITPDANIARFLGINH